MTKETNIAKSLDLTFDFHIKNRADRTLIVDLRGLLREIEFDHKHFTWFMEDLVYFMKKQKMQRRWEFSTIEVVNCKNLNTSKKTFEEFEKFIETVIQWTMILKW